MSDGEGTSTGVTLNCLSSIAPYIAVRALLLPTHPLSPFPACCLNRVVRGSLLAVGRPDGRLNALASAESAVCLSVNQASSIQHFGVTCESFTLGHNPYSLNSTQADLHIPTARLQVQAAQRQPAGTAAARARPPSPPTPPHPAFTRRPPTLSVRRTAYISLEPYRSPAPRDHR